ncbi:hypothetical protein EUGRSUZ_H01141 [Eucalyptus grandis]|uniref:Uncharacterized protein n=2 Tax=Eucalyptus grandis TaxID=71139 RepID=A0ACC3JND9_EUCGR|nr:hypothetical protein EUGRSUZ_H01141 [Eucalyptus grandis]
MAGGVAVTGDAAGRSFAAEVERRRSRNRWKSRSEEFLEKMNSFPQNFRVCSGVFFFTVVASLEFSRHPFNACMCRH